MNADTAWASNGLGKYSKCNTLDIIGWQRGALICIFNKSVAGEYVSWCNFNVKNPESMSFWVHVSPFTKGLFLKQILV